MKSNESEQRVKCVRDGESTMACEANASRKHGDSDDGSWDASYHVSYVTLGGHCASVLKRCAVH